MIYVSRGVFSLIYQQPFAIPEPEFLLMRFAYRHDDQQRSCKHNNDVLQLKLDWASHGFDDDDCTVMTNVKTLHFLRFYNNYEIKAGITQTVWQRVYKSG